MLNVVSRGELKVFNFKLLASRNFKRKMTFAVPANMECCYSYVKILEKNIRKKYRRATLKFQYFSFELISCSSEHVHE